MNRILSLLAIGLFALAYLTASADAHAGVGALASSTALVPVAFVGAGAVARLMVSRGRAPSGPASSSTSPAGLKASPPRILPPT